MSDVEENLADLAYPVQVKEPSGVTFTALGLTRRELYAAMVMQGLIAANDQAMPQPYPQAVAKLAVVCADALLAELAKASA